MASSMSLLKNGEAPSALGESETGTVNLGRHLKRLLLVMPVCEWCEWGGQAAFFAADVVGKLWRW